VGTAMVGLSTECRCRALLGRGDDDDGPHYRRDSCIANHGGYQRLRRITAVILLSRIPRDVIEIVLIDIVMTPANLPLLLMELEALVVSGFMFAVTVVVVPGDPKSEHARS
jgi:hypothetical protein